MSAKAREPWTDDEKQINVFIAVACRFFGQDWLISAAVHAAEAGQYHLVDADADLGNGEGLVMWTTGDLSVCDASPREEMKYAVVLRSREEISGGVPSRACQMRGGIFCSVTEAAQLNHRSAALCRRPSGSCT